MAVFNSPPPECLLRAGPLALKRTALAPAKRFVILCAPLSTTDIRAVFSFAFKTDPLATLEHKQHLAWLGNIACAAVKGTPLLIILGPDGGGSGTGSSTTAPVFVQFSDIRAISDETQLRSACNFALHVDVKPYDYKFAVASSTDYQQWNAAFGRAMSVLTDRTMGGLRGSVVALSNDDDLGNSEDGGDAYHRRRRTASSQSGILFDFESATSSPKARGSNNNNNINNTSSSSSSSAAAALCTTTTIPNKKLSTASSSAASSPPTSPLHHHTTQQRAKKVPVLADRVAPPSLSRKYALDQPQQQQPLSSASSAASSPRPRSAGSAHSVVGAAADRSRSSSSQSSPTTTPPTTTTTPLPPSEAVDLPEQHQQ
ncbi:hypothetical protein HDU87_003244 [Geranomyces variabilis]|uniref:Uncharacterized protein n=1 Tax=Geranomyces variabilis TaxID=109894 RepID=A0AAD5TLW1_9FUNG|nr:hypothetical protein HDU87_003244 [Geranomyces variabilis]